MTKIIALSGKKASGKSTSCEFIRKSYNQAFKYYNENGVAPDEICIYNFADELKNIAVNMLGLPANLVYGSQADKETLTSIRGRDLYEFSKTLYRLSSTHPLERFTYLRENDSLSVRDVLKLLGNFMRCLNVDCWINSVLHKIRQENPKVALIGDCRFSSEAIKIKQNGGYVIRLTRHIDNDQDVSEVDLDNYTEFDEVIENHEMSLDERNECLNEFMMERILKPY